MTARVKATGAVCAVIIAAALYFQTTTGPGRRAITAPEPAIASGSTRSVDRDRLMADMTLLASSQMQGRETGTPGGRKARAWIVGQFQAIGLEPAGDEGYLQPFSFIQLKPAGDAANVLGRLDGSVAGASPIVISAHYDHLGMNERFIFYGADDNASGVAALLAFAWELRRRPLRHPAMFVAFDAEEPGFEGAKALLRVRPALRTALINVNMDMVSRNDRNEIFAAGTYHSPQLTPMLEEVRNRARVKLLF